MSTSSFSTGSAGASPWPTTLVTGASSGIGRALALQLAARGVRVLALGRDIHRLEELARLSDLVVPVQADLARIDALPALAAALAGRHPDLGCLVNNAGIQFDQRMDDPAYGAAAIRQELDINLAAPLVLTHSLLPHLRGRPRAAIVNLTSGLAYAPKKTAAVYSASKAGLHLATRALRVQMQGGPVRVVEAVMPLVDTPMTAGRGSGKLSPAEAARQILQGLDAGVDDIRVGKAWALPWLQRWAPSLLASVMQRG